jgi:hypothetical protein
MHALERGKPKNRKSIDWKLITDLPVRSLKDAIEKLRWYSLRWKIEVLHKVLKSGVLLLKHGIHASQRPGRHSCHHGLGPAFLAPHMVALA